MSHKQVKIFGSAVIFYRIFQFHIIGGIHTSAINAVRQNITEVNIIGVIFLAKLCIYLLCILLNGHIDDLCIGVAYSIFFVWSWL